jgi:hypothetical protein
MLVSKLIDIDYGPANSWWHTPEDTLHKLSAHSFQVRGDVLVPGRPPDPVRLTLVSRSSTEFRLMPPALRGKVLMTTDKAH